MSQSTRCLRCGCGYWSRPPGARCCDQSYWNGPYTAGLTPMPCQGRLVLEGTFAALFRDLGVPSPQAPRSADPGLLVPLAVAADETALAFQEEARLPR